MQSHVAGKGSLEKTLDLASGRQGASSWAQAPAGVLGRYKAMIDLPLVVVVGNTCIQLAEAGELPRVQGQHGLHRETLSLR